VARDAATTPIGPVDARSLDVGVLVDSAAAAAPGVLDAVAALAAAVAVGGGMLVVPAGSPALAPGGPLAAVVPALRAPEGGAPEPTLAFGQSARHATGSAAGGRVAGAGLHVMDMPAVRDVTEAVAGLVAAGAHAILSITVPTAPGERRTRPVAGHPFVPVIRVLCVPEGVPVPAGPSSDAAAVDAILVGGAATQAQAASWAAGMLTAVAAACGPSGKPTRAQAASAFSVARGLTGVTT
jgi:hypothetical protein